MKALLYITLFLSVFYSCSCKQKQKKSVESSFYRFDKILNEVAENKDFKKLEELRTSHPDFWRLYASQILFSKSDGLQDVSNRLVQFASDSAYRFAYLGVQSQYPSTKAVEEQINSMFSAYRQWFSPVALPKVFFMISGFSKPLIMSETSIGVSLDMYLGEKNRMYQMLLAYDYQRLRFNSDRIAADMLYILLSDKFPYNVRDENLLVKMVYEGKIAYLTRMALPEISETTLFYYTQEQLKWAKAFEADSWRYMADSKHLFSTNHIQIQKYCEEAPFTGFFGSTSAPRMGNYIGYKIVESYIKRNKSVTPSMLMANTNAQEILEKSGYRP